LYFHQNFPLFWDLLLNIFYFAFGKKQTQHFIPRKLSSKPNARGKVRNNKYKTITYWPTFISLLNLIHCLFL
jgi:hypothetical protein